MKRVALALQACMGARTSAELLTLLMLFLDFQILHVLLPQQLQHTLRYHICLCEHGCAGLLQYLRAGEVRRLGRKVCVSDA